MTEIVLSITEEYGLHRIDLHVVENNRGAMNLYKILGFTIEGMMRYSYFGANSKYHKMLVTGILLPRS